MTKERYKELMENPQAELTKEEWAEGWHFCTEWDFLLIGPGDDELNACACPVAKHLPRPEQHFPDLPDENLDEILRKE